MYVDDKRFERAQNKSERYSVTGFVRAELDLWMREDRIV